MTRSLRYLLVSALLLFGLATSPPASAADPLTGRLVDATTSRPAIGVVVRLRILDSHSRPGEVVDRDRTDRGGRFSLNAGTSGEDEFYVEVMSGRYQGGYVGGRWVQPTAGTAATFAPGSALGHISINPAFIAGVVVNSRTGQPLRGIKVSARSSNDLSQPEGRDRTDRLGRFWIGGIECEDDCYLRLRGVARGYENGFRVCDGRVVPTYGLACASPLGHIGRVRLDRR